jgi:glycosyltransferase involved in cell wall biosynthesis
MILRELIDEGRLDVEKVCIRYAGPSKMAFTSLSRRFGLDRCVEAFDTVPRATSLKYQLESHLLLLASWNKRGEEGIITGKLLEYMMIGCPVIGLVSGEIKDSAVREMLRLGNLGVCYEQANKEQDFSLVKQYVVEQYNQFIDGAQSKHKPNQEYIEQYNYQNLTKQLVSHFPEEIHQRICNQGRVSIQ